MENDTINATFSTAAKQNDGISLSAMDVLSLTIYGLVFVFGTLGNGLVIYVTGYRMKKTVNSVWFLNLAVADFLFTAFLILSVVYVSRGYNWPFDEFVCRLNALVSVINMFASIFLLMGISLDRCLSTWVVVWAQNKRTPRKAELICVFIWLAALGCSLPYSISREIHTYGKRRMCAYSSNANLSTLTIFRFVLGFAVPFIIIITSYIAIGIRARRLQRKKKRKSLRIIITIILAFFLCWMPFHIFQFLQMHNRFLPILRHAIPLSTNLAFFNSCLNPVLYVFMCDEFQKKLKLSVCHVLESAFAEDAHSFVSSRSFASHFSKISRKSDTIIPGERKNTSTSISTLSSEVKVVLGEKSNT